MSLPPDLAEAIRHAVADHGGPRGARIEALRLVQKAEGWVSDARLREVAELLGATPAEMENLATFYSLIFRRPVGGTVILLCDGASCWLNGADAVRDALMARLGIGYGGTTPDGRVTLINVACLGACDRAPAAAVGPDRTIAGPLSPDDLAPVLEGGA